MSGPFVGQRVLLKSLMSHKYFPGEIVEVGNLNLCRVKLDSQAEPVGSVLYYGECPDVIKSNLWQVCWPAPKRIQRRRTKGWKMPEGAVSVTRPGKWGNPFRVIPGSVSRPDNAAVVEMFKDVAENEKYQGEKFKQLLASIEQLRGKDLACWCRLCEAHKDGKPLGVECPDCDPCHADVLLQIANGETAVSQEA